MQNIKTVALLSKLKNFAGPSAIANLEQAIGQYILYQLLLKQVDPEREVYLAIPDTTYYDVFSEPIGELVIAEIPLKLVIIDLKKPR